MLLRLFIRTLFPDMKTFPHSKLVRPDVLSELSRTSIVALLAPFADYFAARGAPLDAIADERTPIHDVMLVVATPSESTPAELVERLEMLDLISDAQSSLNFEEGHAALVENLREEGDSTADLAVKILLHEPSVAWREFSRQALLARRSLVSLGIRPGLKFRPPTAERIDEFRQMVIPWFRANARSEFCQVHFRDEPGGVSFVIRHGDLLKRIGVFEEDGRTGSRILRPERLDVAHYRETSGEWRISGLGGRLQELYRQAFGKVFHGSPDALFHARRYSLEPLREGPGALACDPSGRVQTALLKSLKLRLHNGLQIAISNGNIFAGLLALNSSLWQTATFLEARIDFKLSNRRSMVPIVINPITDKVSGDHSEEAVEKWLIEHHFAHSTHERFVLEIA
jgi:hypothetical protein